MGHGPKTYVSRREFIRRVSAAGLVTSAGTWYLGQPATAQSIPVEQIHVQFGTDASTQMVVSWMTPEAVTGPFVQLGGQRVAADTVSYDGYPGHFHHARVDGLLPGTAYPYAVGHADTVLSDVFAYETAPSGRAAFTFTAFGDQGTDTPDLTNVQDFDPTTLATVKVDQQPPYQASLNRDLAFSMTPAFHAIVGDTSYANGDQAVWDEWFRGIQKMAATMPWMPCIGNHEIELAGGIGGFDVAGALTGVSDSWGPNGYDAYLHRFALPTNGDASWEGAWYRFRYGSVEFISIDNNDVNVEVTANIGYSDGRQKAFVENALQAAHTDPGVDFIVVLMHQAAYSTGLHGNDQGVRDTWFTMFSDYGVDLVLQGHDHHYERSHLMDHDEVVLAADDGTYRSDRGTMYVVCGNGGGVQRPHNPVPGDSWIARKQLFVVGTLRVDVIPDTGEGTKRLVLGEYNALDGSPVEEGIVIERPLAAATTGTGTTDTGTTETPVGPEVASEAATPVVADAAADTILPVTGGPAGIGLLGAAAGAAGVGARVWRRRYDDEDLVEARAHAAEAARKADLDER